MNVCKFLGISSNLSSNKRIHSPSKPLFTNTFTEHSLPYIPDPSGPLSSVKFLALYDFTDATLVPPDSLSSYYFAKAVEQYNNSEFFSAIHTFKRALAYSPGHFESYINLGACYYRLQMMDEAVGVFSRAIKMYPSSPIPYVNKALSEMQQQVYDKVIATVDLAVEQLEDPPEELYKIRTYVLYQSGKITNILEGIKAKNGFERSWTVNRKGGKETVSQSSTISRPKSSSVRKNRVVNLFPHSEKSFVKVEEVGKSFKGTGKVKTVSENSSPIQVRKNSSRKIRKKICIVPEKSSRKDEELIKKTTIREKKLVIEPKLAYKPGVIQINAMEKNEEYIEDREAAQKFAQNLKVLRKIVAHDLERAEELKESSKDNDYQFISEYQIKVLIEEFSKSYRSVDKIDKIAVKLDFLQKFPLAMRENIYSCAQIGSFAPGDIIFTENNPGDSMFVIIKGSVIINKKMTEVRDYPVIIASLYDGRQFGDVSLIDTKSEEQERGTCIVTEPSTMFIIPKTEYKRLLFKYLKPEIEAKATFLSTIHLFKGAGEAQLYTMASNISVNKYRLGEVILKKGDMPKGLYIICSGHVEVVTECTAEKAKRPKLYGNAKIREKSPRPFYTGTVSPSFSPKPKSFDDPLSFSHLEKPNKQSASFESSTKITTNILNFVLHTSEYFGGKTLIANEIVHGTQFFVTPAKFTFLAKSSEVDIIMVTKDLLRFLDQQTEVRLRNVLSKTFHIDSPEEVDADEMDELFTKWQKFKVDFVDDIRKQKYLERNRKDFPYIR
jgi:tetratricopeptide (TPR) repeat protein/CRP-like cAMP-binding protein